MCELRHEAKQVGANADAVANQVGDLQAKVDGNTTGLKSSQVKALERLARRRLSEDRLVTNDFARALTELSGDVRRQVGVLIDRTGCVQHVMIGTGSGIELPDWGRLRAGRGHRNCGDWCGAGCEPHPWG